MRGPISADSGAESGTVATVCSPVQERKRPIDELGRV